MHIHRLQKHLPEYRLKAELLAAGLMVFFFVIFDGILMYLAPIVMTGAGISDSLMGLIIGSSSVAGMLFDFILCRALKQTHYRRMFLLMFILAGLFPLFLFGGKTVTIYLIAMAAWGFYYDFFNIGTIDFVERTADAEQQVSHFGILSSFQGIGYLLAPFAASLLLLFLHPGPRLLLALAVPLGIAFFFYVVIALRPAPERDEYGGVTRKTVFSLFGEIELWEKIWVVLFPILLLTLIINLVDAAIWTFGPLFSEQLGAASGFSGGLFMTAYALPPILVGWFVGRITRKFGNRRTAQGAIALGSIVLASIGFVASALLLVPLIFAASFFISIGWPAINAVYTERIEKIPARRKEVETIQDLFTNLGDTGGPIVGGYMAQYLGFAHSFVALGVLGAIIAAGLFLVAPREKEPETHLSGPPARSS